MYIEAWVIRTGYFGYKWFREGYHRGYSIIERTYYLLILETSALL